MKFSIGDQVYYFRGVGKAKSAWAHRWHGPAVVIGFEGNNLWLQHRGIAVNAAARHVRAAEPEECVPWASLLDEDVKTLNEESTTDTDSRLPDVGMPPMQGGYLDLGAPQRRPREEAPPREEPPAEVAGHDQAHADEAPEAKRARGWDQLDREVEQIFGDADELSRPMEESVVDELGVDEPLAAPVAQ